MLKLSAEQLREIEQYIQLTVQEDISINEKRENLKKFISKYREYNLTAKILGKIFLLVNPCDEDGFSLSIKMDKLISYHPSFRTTNGSTWCRDDQSFLGKRFIIRREYDKGSISEIKLEGFNKRKKIDQGIRSDIDKIIKSRRCVILDVSTNIETDHKDGQKDDWRMNDKSQQRVEDFQPLCKVANDAKRSHCNRCKKTGKRYDARQLGYKVSFTKGDENTKNCQGCYFYDPKKFNEEISKNFDKKL